MARRLESLLETETVIRWDETGEPATLWTASKAVRNVWKSYGFPVEAFGGGWRALVPPDRITYRPLRKPTQKAQEIRPVSPEPALATEG